MGPFESSSLALLLSSLPAPVLAAGVFVVGAMVGSFLNVCIYRLPLEKSLFWPGSRCGHCFQAIRWYDNIPLLSYWVLRGRCRVCGQRFSVRYFLIELLTALCFVGLFYAEVAGNVHGFQNRALGLARYESGLWTTFGFHAVLVSFLLVATFCDFDHQAIPLSLTLTGTAVGLLGSVLFPWPWPYRVRDFTGLGLPPGGPSVPWWDPGLAIPQGLYPWPVWGPVPAWLAPAGGWKLGLATGLAGMLAGTLVLRAVRFLFGLGMGAEYMEPEEAEEPPPPTWAGGRLVRWVQRVGGKALGLGDADLMMMAGSFLGWQPTVAAFLIGIFPGLVLGLGQLFFRRESTLPFGPALALGVVIAMLAWPSIGATYQLLFFQPVVLLGIVVAGSVLMLVAAYMLRLMRVLRA